MHLFITVMNVVNQRWCLVMILDSLLTPYSEPLFTTTIARLPCVFHPHAQPHKRACSKAWPHGKQSCGLPYNIINFGRDHLVPPDHTFAIIPSPTSDFLGIYSAVDFGRELTPNQIGMVWVTHGNKKRKHQHIMESFATNFNQFNLSHPFQSLYSHLLMICILQCCLFPCSVATSLTALRGFSSSRGGLTRCCPRSGGSQGPHAQWSNGALIRLRSFHSSPAQQHN